MEIPQSKPVNNFPHCAKDIKQKCGVEPKQPSLGATEHKTHIPEQT